MILFKCRKCGYSKEVSDKYAGKRVHCPKCKAVNIVGGKEPAEPKPKKEVIKFYCPSCGQKIGLDKEYAGKRVRCGKCKNPLEVPFSSQGKRPEPAKEKEAEEILRPPAEEPAKDDFGFDFPADMGDMLQMEKESYTVAPPVETADERISREQSEMLASYSGAEESYPASEDKSSRTKLFVIIGSVAAGAVLLIIIMASVFSSFGGGAKEEREEVDYFAAEQFAEEYIQLLIAGDTEKAWELTSRQIQREYEAEYFPSVTAFLEGTAYYEIVSRNNYYMEESEKYIFGFSYKVQTEVKEKTFFIMLEPIEDSFVVQGLDGMEADSEELFGEFVYLVASDFDEIMFRLEEPEVFAVFSFLKKIGPSTLCFIFIMLISLWILLTISLCIVFHKAGEPAWAAIIPIYSMWVLAEVGDKPGWYGLVVALGSAVPFVGWLLQLVFLLIIDVGVAKSFDKSIVFGLGLFLFPFIFYPILAFSKD